MEDTFPEYFEKIPAFCYNIDDTGHRLSIFGGIGDAGGSLSGVYPYGSGHSYFYEFTPVVAASVIDTNGNRVHIVSDGAVALMPILIRKSWL